MTATFYVDPSWHKDPCGEANPKTEEAPDPRNPIHVRRRRSHRSGGEYFVPAGIDEMHEPAERGNPSARSEERRVGKECG